MSREILVIDCGSQTSDLIVRRCCELGANTKLISPEQSWREIATRQPAGVILSGSKDSVYEEGSVKVDPRVFQTGIPTLGICYGQQQMVQTLGGEVQRASGEYGREIFTTRFPEGLLANLPKRRFWVVVSHGDTVTKLPEGFESIGHTARVENAAIVDRSRNLYGLQFHPEVADTEFGELVFRNFVNKICGIEPGSTRLDPELLIAEVQRQVGGQKVIGAVSGGVDSTMAAWIMHQAIGPIFLPIHIESGLMRAGTTELARDIFTKVIGRELRVINAHERFLEVLKGVTDPEAKRRAVGKLYIDLFQEEADRLGANWLCQGTIYSDVIESKGSKHASNIKSHHNVGGLPVGMRLTLVEPLRQLYKDQVRGLAKMVGLPQSVINLQPFPGPGYAIRIRGEVTGTRLAQVRASDAIVVEEMKSAEWYDRVFQCFAVMIGTDSTAVKGDAREFSEVVAIRVIESRDVMTAQPAQLPWPLMLRMTSRIVNEVPAVSRVVYDLTPKPPATMEWE